MSGASSDLTKTFAVKLMENLIVPTFVLDPSGKVIIWNFACERLTGLPASQVIGTDKHWMGLYRTKRPCLADLVLRGASEDVEGLYVVDHSETFGDSGLSAENWCEPPNCGGRRRYLAFDAGPIFGERGELIAVVETLRDMTVQKEAQMALEALASQDGLTGIANRRVFDEVLARECATASERRRPLSLLMIDIDHFKRYNDALGHQSGDDCLRRTAAILSAAMESPSSLVARYGGEEFVAVLPDTDLAGALDVAERILADLSQAAMPHPGLAPAAKLSVSIGAATREHHATTPERLLSIADASLYRAKSLGRNRVVAAQRTSTLMAAI
ncbi:MAG: diguanylate cyclase [Rhizobiaceae bacterium]|nr:diguanylate cyclase [Rhizobiaceae bacterium]